jgi:hypothetical protein
MPSLRLLATCLALAVTLAGCSRAAPRTAPPTQRLPADSLALLNRALAQAQPGFATHAAALRSGIYQLDGPRYARVQPEPGRPAPATTAANAFVIQIAAFSDAASADAAARDAVRRFPGRSASVEAAGPLFRVTLGEWPQASDAQADLPAIRAVFPGAWVRPRASGAGGG